MFDECVLGVRANVFTTNELKRQVILKMSSFAPYSFLAIFGPPS